MLEHIVEFTAWPILTGILIGHDWSRDDLHCRHYAEFHLYATMQLTPYDSRGQEIGFLVPDCLKCRKCEKACPTKIIEMR